MKQTLRSRGLEKTCLLILVLLGLLSFSLAQSQTSVKESFSTPSTAPTHYEITPASLPPPNLGPDAENPLRVVTRPADATLHMPPGFEISTFAEGDFRNARWMALAPNGDVFVTDADAGMVIVLRDTDGDGKAETRFTFAKGLTSPFGIAFWHDYVYVGMTDAVVRFAYKPGQTEAQGSPEKIADLPGRGYRQHWTRNVIFDRAGKKLY